MQADAELKGREEAEAEEKAKEEEEAKLKAEAKDKDCGDDTRKIKVDRGKPDID